MYFESWLSCEILFFLLAFRAIYFRYGIVTLCVNCPHVRAAGLNANGPAIKGGCVTWRSHPATYPGALAGKLSRGQDRYGVLFAIRVQILLHIGAIAVQG